MKGYNIDNLGNNETFKTSQAAQLNFIKSDVANIKSNFANSSKSVINKTFKKEYKKEYIVIALLALVLYMLMNTSNTNKSIIIARLSYL